MCSDLYQQSTSRLAPRKNVLLVLSYSIYQETQCSAEQAPACLPLKLVTHNYATGATILIPDLVFFPPSALLSNWVHPAKCMQPCSCRVDMDHTAPQHPPQINGSGCCLHLQVTAGSFVSQIALVHRERRSPPPWHSTTVPLCKAQPHAWGSWS